MKGIINKVTRRRNTRSMTKQITKEDLIGLNENKKSMVEDCCKVEDLMGLTQYKKAMVDDCKVEGAQTIESPKPSTALLNNKPTRMFTFSEMLGKFKSIENNSEAHSPARKRASSIKRDPPVEFKTMEIILPSIKNNPFIIEDRKRRG